MADRTPEDSAAELSRAVGEALKKALEGGRDFRWDCERTEHVVGGEVFDETEIRLVVEAPGCVHCARREGHGHGWEEGE